HQIAADFVAFVDGGPQLAAVRLPGQPVGIAQARGEQAQALVLWVDFQDGGAVFLRVHAVFTDVAVGAAGDIQARAVTAGDHVLGPVVVYWAGRQIDHFFPGLVDPRGAFFIGEAQQRVGVGDVQPVVDQRHAKGRVQTLKQYRAHFGCAVTI